MSPLGTERQVAGGEAARGERDAVLREPEAYRMITFVRAQSDDHIEQVRALFQEYANALGIDLSFQNFAQELAGLPGDYAPPHGRLLLALYETEVAGCLALRRLADGVCEGKRLYIRPPFRGKGVGRALKLAMLHEARQLGYQCFRWDSLPFMTAANALYRSIGAKNIEPYCSNPIERAMFWELDLSQRLPAPQGRWLHTRPPEP
ncbi:hypothetical protein NKDENANG_02467 [Candidatus Entotheonellaceae bacterium PAL068K]